MEGCRYRRPRLCRLCECPVVDGGVLLQKPQIEKLSRWWKAHWDTDLKVEQKNCYVCHFCVWDLRFADQNSEEKEPPDQIWWTKYYLNNNYRRNYYKYYRDEWMKPCSVKIAPLKNEDKLLEEYSQGEFGSRCIYCPKSFPTLKILVNHAKMDHADQFIQCKRRRCGKLFHTYKERAEHVTQEHVDENSLKCVYCGKVSTNYANNYDHLQKHHKSQLFRCSHRLCTKYFKTAEDRDRHFDKFHSSGEYFCCFCDRYFESTTLQRHHIITNHKDAVKCNAGKMCPNYFKTEEDMQKHIQEIHLKNDKCLYCGAFIRNLAGHVKKYHKDVALRCEYSHLCKTWFKTEEERQKHYVEKHESGDDLIPCPLCNKKFSTKKKGMQTHMRNRHRNQTYFKCNYEKFCVRFFSSEEDRLKHIKEVHESHDEKLRCVYCDKFVLKNMICHVNKWHKDVSIKCNFQERCPTYFKTLEDREKHVREVHQAEKIREQLQCLYCDKILIAERNSLRAHVNLKHPEIAIKCQYRQCGTFFKKQEDLEKHLSLKPMHRRTCKKDDTQRTKIGCAKCYKLFNDKSELKKHVISVHSGYKDICPYCKKPLSIFTKWKHIISSVCSFCNKKFRCLGLLRSHTVNCKPVFRCPVCSKSYKFQSDLNIHCKFKHTVPILKWKGLQFESRGFRCADCYSYYGSKTALERHRNTFHKTSKKFTCNTCRRKFSRKRSLEYHISRKHLGLMKLFQCPVCNLKLVSEKMLKKHVQNKCIENFVECEFCAKKVKPQALKRHIHCMH